MGDAAALRRRGLLLEYVTLGWNVVGAPVMLATALSTGSTALAGFGLDSLIEIFASTVVIWQLKGETGPLRERRAMRLIGAAFLALAAYLLVQSLWVLLGGHRSATSPLGIAWLVMTVIAMALLAAGKRATGRALGNPVLVAEAKVTLIDAALAAAVLAGVALNAGLGWRQADPAAGLVIVCYGLREGLAAFKSARS
jgi:divalent metal cation (Fe/Co/Zn/Cd) transporter